jgi:hypothetical protein
MAKHHLNGNAISVLSIAKSFRYLVQNFQLALGSILLLLICFVRVRSILGPDILSLFCGQRTRLNFFSSGGKSGLAFIIILMILMTILTAIVQLMEPLCGGGCRFIGDVRSWKAQWRRLRFIQKEKTRLVKE